MSPFGPEFITGELDDATEKRARSPLAGLRLPCSVCGWEYVVSPYGFIPGHRQWRIDRWGQPYRHPDQCDGGMEPPDTSGLNEEMVCDG